MVHADALLDTLRKQDVAFASSTSFSSSSAAAANASIPATVAATADPTDVVNAAVAEFDKAVIRFQHSSRDIVWECKELSAFAEILHASTMRDLTAVINARIVACEINGDLPLCLRFLNVHPSFADVLQNVVDGVHSTTQINMQTTLELAVTNNHVDVVHYLARLSNLSCPHIAMDVNDPKTTLLSTAILHRSFACIDELMRFRDFDPNAKCLDAGFNDTFAIIFAAQRNGAAAIRSLSKSPRLLANAKSHYSGSYDVLALTAAAKRGDLDSLNALLALPGIDVNAATYSPTGKQTALHIAATDGTDACIAALLKHKDINVNVCDNRMKTPLQKAIAAGNFCTVRLLVQHPRIEINKICSESGDTALHCALDAGNSRVVELILQHPEINVNVQNNSGKTAAMVAAISMPQMFKHIIHFRNCDETKKDKDGKTALEHYHNVHWSGTDKSVAGSKRRR